MRSTRTISHATTVRRDCREWSDVELLGYFKRYFALANRWHPVQSWVYDYGQAFIECRNEVERRGLEKPALKHPALAGA